MGWFEINKSRLVEYRRGVVERGKGMLTAAAAALSKLGGEAIPS